MTYSELLNAGGYLLAFDGWYLASYMLLVGIIAAIMRLKTLPGQFFVLWLLGVFIAFVGPEYSNVVMDARFPLVFVFCFGIVGVGLAAAGFIAICMSPSIFAFLSKIKGKWWMLTANIAMVFPFGPVILFIFVLKEYKKSLATMAGDLVQST